MTSLEEAGVAMVDKDSSVALALPNLLRVRTTDVMEHLNTLYLTFVLSRSDVC